jgi:hypothetical protein
MHGINIHSTEGRVGKRKFEAHVIDGIFEENPGGRMLFGGGG